MYTNIYDSPMNALNTFKCNKCFVPTSVGVVMATKRMFVLPMVSPSIKTYSHIVG